ncbi:MAG: DUF6797 domain-containing protein [Verrucomicrobiota bacterium]
MKRGTLVQGKPWAVVVCICVILSDAGVAQELRHLEAESKFGPYVEEDAPFFGQVVDGRGHGVGIIPRGVVLPLGNGLYGCFDPDLLRLAIVWRETGQGEWLEMNSMSAGSYRVPSLKAPPGQEVLPKVKGEMICGTRVVPGWAVGEPVFEDVRERGIASKKEVGLGALDRSETSFKGLRPRDEGVLLEYEIGSVQISEYLLGIEGGGLVRLFGIEPREEALSVVIGTEMGDTRVTASKGVTIRREGDVTWAVIPGAQSWESFAVFIGKAPRSDWTPPIVELRGGELRGGRRWDDAVETSVLDGIGAGYVIDEIPLPVSNPWKRNVRLSGMDFFSDGRLAVCTFDGDIWVVDGLSLGSDVAVWRRYASGLHEPMALQVVEDEVFVFDRAGIWRLNDENGDGETDFYEMWSNVVPQTAETREFAMGLLEKPGGGFYVAKGGQEVSTKGIANGTISEVSADGKSYEIFASGLRQPFAGIDPITGMITSSDQQGHWVPSTPIHVIERGRHYGYVPKVLEQVRYEGLQEPAVWIPHIVNQSGAKQVWLRDAEMGPLSDALIHIGYNRPELFRVFFDEAGSERQGAVASVVSGFPCALLDGAVNPVDGQLYVCGFRIWGTALDQISGLFRVRYTGEIDTSPEDVCSEERGILLRFGYELDEVVATNPMSYTVERWNYQRSKEYGSGHYRLDGEPGQEAIPVASATLSEDGRAVFLGIPGMKPVDTMSVRYRVGDGRDVARVQSAYLTVHQLNGFDLREAGFETDDVDLEIDDSLLAAAASAPDPSVDQGMMLATTIGCVACHSVDGSKVAAQPGMVVGPTWKGLWGTRRELSDGTVVKSVDASYLRESILEPAAKMAVGFENMGVGMPSYLGILQDWQVESLVMYIESLAGERKRSGEG